MIIDDEQHSINLLEEFIKDITDLKLVLSTTNVLEAISFIQNEMPDIIFLDINMPKVSGFEFLKLIKSTDHSPYVILITAYSEYAVQGFDLDVFDYLVKPVPFERFLKSIQKVQLLQKKLKNTDSGQEDYFFVKVDSKNKSVKISLSEILYIQGLKNYVSIFTSSGRIVTMLNMKDIEDHLKSNKFIRVHRSYIIPTDRISKIDGNRVFISPDSTEIPIGESYKDALYKFLSERSIK